MENQKTYVNWYCKAIATQYWEIINFEVNAKDLDLLPKNERWFVKLSMMKRKETGKYWETHYMVLNTYQKPEWQSTATASNSSVDDDMPF